MRFYFKKKPLYLRKYPRPSCEKYKPRERRRADEYQKHIIHHMHGMVSVIGHKIYRVKYREHRKKADWITKGYRLPFCDYPAEHQRNYDKYDKSLYHLRYLLRNDRPEIPAVIGSAFQIRFVKLPVLFFIYAVIIFFVQIASPYYNGSAEHRRVA